MIKKLMEYTVMRVMVRRPYGCWGPRRTAFLE